ncbi:MAG TPA: RICIN domain-containing protein [Vicinamibacterales bacterium]|nr:RICIN domain-containing protein [Vicinamibacterales bacterium]
MNAIAVFAFLLGGLLGTAQNPDGSAERSFEDARSAFDQRQWESAVSLFEQSYRLYPDTLTAYFLCLGYAHLNQASKTGDYARRALSGSPRLRDEYRHGAEWLLDRITENKSPIFSVSTGATFDTYTPPVPRESTLGLPTPASGDPEPDGIYELQSARSGLCLDVWTSTTEEGGRLAQATCHGSANQQFQLKASETNEYLLVARHSQQCVDVTAESLDNGASIVQYPCHGRTNQRFRFVRAGDNFEVVAVHSSKCLDVWEESREPGADIRQYQCHGRPNQLWILRRVQ